MYMPEFHYDQMSCKYRFNRTNKQEQYFPPPQFSQDYPNYKAIKGKPHYFQIVHHGRKSIKIS